MQLPPAVMAIATDPLQTALLFDVDGTLAPIVERPGDAVVPDETRAQLRRLAAIYGLVACVSGRTGADAAHIVGVAGIRVVGEHGLELAPEAEEWVDRIAAFADEFPHPAPERKRLTVSYHYRGHADEAGARRQLDAIAMHAVERGLVPRYGRMVLEIRPPLVADKGTAVASLLADAGLTRALYAGDDTTDLDAFRALTEIALGVRVAVASEEGPRELSAAADLVVAGPDELLELLQAL
jgi:trehalose 6-phosphate phosphatase